MNNVTLGRTGITVPQNAFGALPIQRVTTDEAVALLRRAYEGGMRYFDTARAYTDSEVKMGIAFSGMREKVIIATKTTATTAEGVRQDLQTSLANLQTDYIDLYQLHNVAQCYAPGDGTGVYEYLLEAKEQGLIRHIGVTAHKIEVAFECVRSGLYETMQFPFSYLTGKRELELLHACEEADMGFIVMKGMAGGLITRSDAAMAFMAQHPAALPIWGIQRESELDEWLSYMDETPEMTPEIAAYIEGERAELVGDFCRGCGYCLPCPVDIRINDCARMSLMVRRSPSAGWLTPEWQQEMAKIEDCLHCGQCASRCPYELDTPALLEKNLADYRNIIAGKVQV
ncbi:aldo/keto reductase [Slackia heliotrinireducens]|uniref:Predicted oxidoreductase of aldo/keto reductase family n=1 Tax=Slackia heliotrinireducens (strain ATCC 29202 / DSM 20476 / NCTC 11029 / RHS 1) TaxID=471855 RepID=C7N3V2_SLAHD|nr:aldo/keto reductase [Slackia heliotrinireducens]ACV21693.1 predicted oxidoreductase of aldo/keto reductase family [Slackia heliotrinireducens DSM 20476]VEG99325.1 General stress protein 69 [Slackia heliotrinireducens]